MAAESIPVELYLPAGGDVSGMTATKNGVEYVPTELCPVCSAVVPQARADQHVAALHPAPPPEVAPAF
jgi:hypothetical protein